MSYQQCHDKNFHCGSVTPVYGTNSIVNTVGTKTMSAYDVEFEATGFVIASNSNPTNMGKGIFTYTRSGITNYNGVISLNPAYESQVANNGINAIPTIAISGTGVQFILSSPNTDQIRWTWCIKIHPNEP